MRIVLSDLYYRPSIRVDMFDDDSINAQGRRRCKRSPDRLFMAVSGRNWAIDPDSSGVQARSGS